MPTQTGGDEPETEREADHVPLFAQPPEQDRGEDEDAFRMRLIQTIEVLLGHLG